MRTFFLVMPDDWIIFYDMDRHGPFAYCSVRLWLEGILEYNL